MSNSAKIKVLLWSPGGAGRHYYGPGTNAYYLYREARRAGNASVTLVHCNPLQQDNESYDEVIQLMPQLPTRALGFPLFLYKSWRFLRQRRNEGYVFHGLDTFSSIFFPAILAHRLGYPTFLKVAATPSGFSSSKNRLLLWLRRKMALKIDRLISLSQETDVELTGAGIPPGKIVRIDNGVDTVHYHRPPQPSSSCEALRQRLNIGEQTRVILATGAVVRRKRPHLLLEGFATLDRSKDSRLVLVGPLKEPDYEQELRTAVRQAGLEERVHFEGYQSDLRPYYEMAHVYALLSQTEGMPNGVLEAMSMQLPVVLAPFSSYSVLCPGDANGRVVTTAAETSQALWELIDNEPLRLQLGQTSRRIVEENFSMQAIWRKYSSAFEQSINRLP